MTQAAIRWAIQELQKKSHPFLGISFLACKRQNLPVGKTYNISLDAITRSHLDQHHQLDPKTAYYFQPFKSNKPWVTPKYPSTGLQSTNTRSFGSAFVHRKGRKGWGFHKNYVHNIKAVVEEAPGYGPTSLLGLAIWIGKDRTWPDDVDISTVVQFLLERYRITPLERRILFADTHTGTPIKRLFTSEPADLCAVAHEFGLPPDAPSETLGALTSLQLLGVGPARQFSITFGDRLTLIAGDNGLGKTFLLDTTWWALTGHWADRPAAPLEPRSKTQVAIHYEVRYLGQQSKAVSSYFDTKTRTWRHRSQKDAASMSPLCLYARVDGSILAFDATRSVLRAGGSASPDVFTADQLWNGKGFEIEGVVRDWANWQMSHDEDNDRDAYSTLVQILSHLSSEDLGTLAPGIPTRLPGDPRTIPTIRFAYGDVPIVLSSAGVQRILALAYIVTWAWQEHLLAATQTESKPVRKMVLLIDEVEAHLHPRWQRSILPALITVGKLLSEELEMQIIATTHSPLILASVERDFSQEADVLYHLGLQDNEVILGAVDYEKYGDSSAWLTSPVFGLRHARSRDAERAIEMAKRIQLADVQDPSEILRVTEELRRCLAPDDAFWPRWAYFAEKVGGDI